MIVELKSGELHMYARSEKKSLGLSVSSDGGESWSNGTPSKITAPSSRFYMRRLPSGRILLLCNDHPEERRNLSAYLSEDECHTWSASLLLDAREPVSYPDAVCEQQGNICVIYDRGRTTHKEILLARFTEADILAGKIVTPDSFLAKVISKAPTVPYDLELYRRTSEADKNWFASFKKQNI
jgi:hypothetical protein